MEAKTKEFIRLLELAEWTQVEAARRLRISEGAVSQICSGKTRPREATLNHLRLLVGREKPEALKPGKKGGAADREAWETELLAELRKLPPAQRQWLGVLVRQMARSQLSRGKRKSKGGK